jgi:transposase-like protein
MLSEVAAYIQAIFNAPDQESAEAFLEKAILKCERSASKLTKWFDRLCLPVVHRHLVRNINGLEWVSREIHWRTRKVGIFPNKAACLRLERAILMEIVGAWQTGRVYMTFDKDDPPL